MHEFPRVIMTVCVGISMMVGGERLSPAPAWGQPISTPLETKTIIGDLLMVDRDFYIVRGEYGEIQIEATHKTEMTEKFGFGDKIKALVLMNNKALKIERAGPNDVAGVVINQPTQAKTGSADAEKGAPVPVQPDTRTIVADLLMVDGVFYIVRSDYGEIQIEATPTTKVSGKFKFGDRIKAVVLMNDKALSIDAAGPNDVPGIVVHKAEPAPVSKKPDPQTADANKSPFKEKEQSKTALGKPASSPESETRTVEGDVLMVDGDFYILRGPEGEIRVERTPTTKMSEEFNFGDRIRAKLLNNDKALSIERAK